MSKTVLIPIPSSDFDPTECAVPWKILSQNGIRVQFATPLGRKADCDRRMLTGSGLSILSPILSADAKARQAYSELENSFEFQHPIPWSEIKSEDFDGLILPGGHAPGMKEYLESTILQNSIQEFFAAEKPVGAICHGVVLAARSKKNGQSILKGFKTTALLSSQELLAWMMTFLWLGDYYRTYSQTVEDEVRSALATSGDFVKGPTPLRRDSLDHLNSGFTVRDRNYLSARWPGDAHRFGIEFLKMLE